MDSTPARRLRSDRDDSRGAAGAIVTNADRLRSTRTHWHWVTLLLGIVAALISQFDFVIACIVWTLILLEREYGIRGRSALVSNCLLGTIAIGASIYYWSNWRWFFAIVYAMLTIMCCIEIRVAWRERVEARNHGRGQ